MNEEQIKQKADDFIITRQKHIKCFSGEAVKYLLKTFAEEIVTEATKELQEENEYLKKNKTDLENKYANTAYQLEGRENEIKELQEEIEELKKESDFFHEEKGNYKALWLKLVREDFLNKKKIADLKEQIEKLKCCYNCSKWNDGSCSDSPNIDTMADFVCDNWKLKE